MQRAQRRSAIQYNLILHARSLRPPRDNSKGTSTQGSSIKSARESRLGTHLYDLVYSACLLASDLQKNRRAQLAIMYVSFLLSARTHAHALPERSTHSMHTAARRQFGPSRVHASSSLRSVRTTVVMLMHASQHRSHQIPRKDMPRHD